MSKAFQKPVRICFCRYAGFYLAASSVVESAARALFDRRTAANSSIFPEQMSKKCRFRFSGCKLIIETISVIRYLKAMELVLKLSTVLLFGLIWFGIVTFLRLKKKKSLVYLIFFTIFYVYLVKVLDYTLFQFQSLLLLKYFMPNLILNGQTAGKNINLIPLITLAVQDLKTSLLNVLLLVPFGFGLPFITNFRMKKIVVIGALFSISIELLQLITGFMAKTTFRIADINDVIFNTVGVAIGYLFFVGFMRIYRRISHKWEIPANPFLRYIAERPQMDK